MGGFDFSAASDFAGQAAYVIACEPEFVSVQPVTLTSFPLTDAPDAFTLSATLQVTRTVTLHALVGWFDADLGADVVLSTAPGVRTHWGQMAFPIPPTSVREGDTLEVTLTLAMDADLRCHYTWRGCARRPGHPAGDVSFSRDTRRRFVDSLEDNSAP